MSTYELVCAREPTVGATTFGKLFRPSSLGPALECYVLEDVVRELPGVPVDRWKIKGQTAIPAGRYRVTLETSPRFGPGTITLHDVPGFAGIRVHAGNDDSDTEGCPLVGRGIQRDPTGDGGNLIESVVALRALQARIAAAIADGLEVFWTVVNPAVNPGGLAP
jgi:Family of unknown function (DUF5675)